MWAGPESLPDEQRGAGEQRLNLGQRRACKVRYARNGERSSPGRADEDRLEAGLAQMLRDRQEAVRRPGLLRRRRDRMNDGASAFGGAGPSDGDQLRPRNLARRRAQIEHRAGQMFRRVDLALHAQNLLRARDPHVVDELLAEVPEAGAIARAGELRHPGAARAAVKIQAELRPEAAQRAAVREAESRPDRDCLRRCRGSDLSTTIARRRSGRQRFRMSSAGVVRTQSPRDRSRRMATRLPRGKHSKTLSTAYSSIFASSTSITGMSSRIG